MAKIARVYYTLKWYSLVNFVGAMSCSVGLGIGSNRLNFLVKSYKICFNISIHYIVTDKYRWLIITCDSLHVLK